MALLSGRGSPDGDASRNRSRERWLSGVVLSGGVGTAGATFAPPVRPRRTGRRYTYNSLAAGCFGEDAGILGKNHSLWTAESGGGHHARLQESAAITICGRLCSSRPRSRQSPARFCWPRPGSNRVSRRTG